MPPTIEPTVGRTVHYVLPALSGNPGKHRAAIITEVWCRMAHATHPGMSNLTVFPSQHGDFPAMPGTPAFSVGSVSYDAGGAPGTWHWPERA